MKLLCHLDLPAALTSNKALAWSSTGSLAVVTNQGVIVFSLIPNASFTGTGLNLEQCALPASTETNPHLVSSRACSNNRLAGHAHPWPEPGKTVSRRIDCVQWSPPGLFHADDDCVLATLSEDHWLRIYKPHPESEARWQLAFDVTLALCELVQPDLSPIPKHVNPVDAIEELKRCNDSVSVVALEWCKVQDSVLLITGQKDRRLAFWKQATQCHSSLLEVFKFVQLENLPCCLARHAVDAQRTLLFVGLWDGRVQVFMLSHTDDAGNLTVESLGMEIWSTADQFMVSCLKVISMELPTLRLVIAKGQQLILADVALGKASVCIKKFRNFILDTDIVDLVLSVDNSCMILQQKSMHKLLVLNEDLGQCKIKDMSHEEVPVDCVHYKAHGMASSAMGAICTFVQCVSVSYDHLILRNPTRLTFITPYTREDLLMQLQALSGDMPLAHIKDLLGVFRALSYTEEKSTACILRGDSPLQKKLSLWMLTLSIKLETDSELKASLLTRLEALKRDFLCEHATTLLEDGSDLSSECQSTLTNFLDSYGDKEKSPACLSSSQNTLGEWKCPKCNTGATQSTIDGVICEEGDAWPRCALSLGLCDGFSMLHCPWCEAVANAEQARNLLKCCPFCGVNMMMTI